MVVIGGLGSLWGSLGGAAFITVLPYFLGPLEDSKEIIHGLIVVAVLLILPRGFLAGIADLAKSRLARGRSAMRSPIA